MRNTWLTTFIETWKKVRKVWQEPRYSSCKMAVRWVDRKFREMVRKRELSSWETKLPNCEVTPKAILLNANSLIERGGAKELSAINGFLGSIFHPLDKASVMLVRCARLRDMWRLRSKPCWQPLLKAPLLSSDNLTAQKKKKTILGVGKGVWFWWHSALMFPAFIQSLPSPLSLLCTLVGSKNHNLQKSGKELTFH